MSNKKHTKRWLFIALWSIAVCTGLFFVLVAFRSSDSKTCSSINVQVTGSQNERFITEEEIKEIISEAGVAEKMPVAEINLRLLEDKLERNPWISNAELFIDKNAALNVQVYENTPVLRVFDAKGNSYYLDASGTIMPPITSYSVKLPVFTGWDPADSAFTGQVLALAAYINNNAFWKAQVQQVDISKEQFTILPSLGDQVIYFGDTALMENKFDRLYQYYTKVAPKAGFNRFESLNVQYAGQIVALNKNAPGVPIDTVSAKRMVRSLIEQSMQLPDSVRAIVPPVQRDTARAVSTPVAAPPKQVGPAPPKQQPKPQVVVPKNAPKPVVPPKPKPAQPDRQPKAVMGRQN